MASIKFTNVRKVYDKSVVAVQDFNLEVADKEFVVFVGPSGCGKSTTLRMLAGLEEITDGTIEIDGEVVNDLQPKDRNIAMVFQNYALYPHLTVFENMAFSLRIKKQAVEKVATDKDGNPKLDKNGNPVIVTTYVKMPEEEIYRRVTEAAEVLGITELLTRKPRALSGGQRQRVAIGRAMVRDSKVFLMDEPLSNLDAKLRNQMRAEIILLRKKINTTFIYVTHDQTEAMTLGDRIVVMKDGFIKQVGTPVEVFDHPANLFVAEFIGAPKMNTFAARLVHENGRYFVKAFDSKIEVNGAKGQELKDFRIEDRDIILGVRPEHISLRDNAASDTIECRVLVNEMMGSELHLHVVTKDEKELIVRVPTINLTAYQRENLRYGSIINISFEGRVMHFFDVNTQENLLK
ncbi:MAG: ATP-binding cassette domain-containing protein [Bacilli bacterium]|nr:ATP-binding cassette domain-containing protein [Bacilli bacterium]